MDATQRIGVFGGTFDPIHIGHLVLAESARAALHLDRVLFIPTARSVFKTDHALASAAVRLSMCEAACAGNEAFSVDDCEIARGGDSYTVDTLRALRERYPGAEFYLVVGSDVLDKLSQWREAETIARVATIAAFKRPGEQPSEAQLDHLRGLGFRLSLHEGPQLVIHSSMLREYVAASRPIRYLVPEPVRRIIEAEGLYRASATAVEHCAAAPMPACAIPGTDGAVIDSDASLDEAQLLSKDFYHSIKAELKDRVDAKRFRHSVGVAKTARRLARLYGVDPAKARLAGILHDWDKCYDDEGMRTHVRELGMEDTIDQWSLEHAPGLLHGHTAARTMASRFPALPADVITAIERHTTAAPNMSPLDQILYIADALEPSRRFRNLDDLRDLVGEAPLDELFIRTYRLWTELLMERGMRLLHPDTVDLWNGFVEARRKGTHSE